MAIAAETAGNPNPPNAQNGPPNKRQKTGGSKIIAIGTCARMNILVRSTSCQMTNSSSSLDMSVKCSIDLLHALLIRFHQVYLETSGNETITSIENAADSVSCAKLYLLDMESLDSIQLQVVES